MLQENIPRVLEGLQQSNGLIASKIRNLYEFLVIELPTAFPTSYSPPKGIQKYASELRKYYFAPEGDTSEKSWFKNKLPNQKNNGSKESGQDPLIELCRAELKNYIPYQQVATRNFTTFWTDDELRAKLENRVQSVGSGNKSFNDGKKEKKVQLSDLQPPHSGLLLFQTSRHWEMVYNALGENIFAALLLDCFIFEEGIFPGGTQNENYYIQIAGKSMADIVWNRPFGTPDHQLLQAQERLKYTKYPRMTVKPKSNFNSYQNLIINRTKIFYCTAHKATPGLFKSHLFNSTDPNIKSKLFIRAMTRIANNQPNNFAFRIRKVVRHTLLAGMGRIVHNHLHKIPYTALMAYHCPIQHNWRAKMRDLIEQKSPKHSLVFEYLFTLASSQLSVSNFIWNCVRRLIPNNLMGNKNMRVLQRKIEQFVSFGRFENYTSFGTLMQGFDPNSAPFLAFQCSNQKQVNPGEESKKKKKSRAQYFMNENSFVLRQFVIWLFEEYIVHVIRTNFYATEKQTDYSKVFYFRKPVWSDIMVLAKGLLTSEMLREVKAEQVKKRLEISKFCLGKLRLIPKKSTVRPIMTFNKMVKSKSGKSSYKAMSQLKSAHAILKTLKNSLRQEKKGYSVFNYYDVMQSLTPFVQSWRESGRPELFSVSLDIQKCYDNVIPTELIHFLNKTELLSQNYTTESYVILKRTRFSQPSARLQKYYRTRNVQIAFDQRRFLGRGAYDKLERNGYDVSRSIIVRKTVYHNVSKQYIVEKLQNIINNTVVSFNKNLFHQIKGIPQGLNVSYILNSFYFSELESAIGGINFIKDVPVTVCMRLTDDYLFITQNKDIALKFMKKLFQISADYQFRFNLSKIRSNFDIEFESLNLPPVYKQHFDLTEITKVTQFEEKDWCTWIGLQIQFSTMWVKPKLPLLPDEKLLSAVTVNFRSRKTSAWLAKKVRTMLLNNLAHFLHTSINSIEMISDLAFEMGQVVAFKMLPCFYDYVKYYQTINQSKAQAEKKMARILKKVFGGMKEYLKNIKWKADKEKKNFEGKNIDVEAPSMIARASLNGFLGLIKAHFYRNYPTLYRVLNKESGGYI